MHTIQNSQCSSRLIGGILWIMEHHSQTHILKCIELVHVGVSKLNKKSSQKLFPKRHLYSSLSFFFDRNPCLDTRIEVPFHWQLTHGMVISLLHEQQLGKFDYFAQSAQLLPSRTSDMDPDQPSLQVIHSVPLISSNSVRSARIIDKSNEAHI